MDHLGHPIQPDTMPRDWRERAEALLWTMRGAEIQHNDIRPDNLLVYEGSLVLIDWQWWTPLGVTPPAEWPPRLGGLWRGGDSRWEFDDRTSLFRVLEAVESGVVVG